MNEGQSAFGEVDKTPDPNDYIGYLESLEGIPTFQECRDKALELLDIRPGQTIVDVGSGLGSEVIRIANAVGETGKVIGVDKSQAMSEYARGKVPSDFADRVLFTVGDAAQLPIDSGSVDGYRSERLLQHVGQPGKAIVEANRVLRTGGRILLIDTDWDALKITGVQGDTTDKIVEYFRNGITNSSIGKNLSELLSTRGFVNVRDIDVVFSTTSVDEMLKVVRFDKIAEKAIKDEVITPPAFHNWLNALRSQEQQGKFSASFPMYIATGIKNKNIRLPQRQMV